MKAVNVHGEADVLASISFRLGLRGQYGPWMIPAVGTAMLSGCNGRCSVDMASSPSASHSVCAEGKNSEDLLEEAIEEELELVDTVDNRDDDFRDTITRGKNFLKLRSESRGAISWRIVR